MTLDLSELCYRKRDVAKHGDGLCCEIPGDVKGSVRFFWGDLF
jgi:hypothetical protein